MSPTDTDGPRCYGCPNGVNCMRAPQCQAPSTPIATPETVTLRPSVQWFAEQMELALRRNDHKGGWAACTHQYLYSRLRQELQELSTAPKGDDKIREAADVANFTMMIADMQGYRYGR